MTRTEANRRNALQSTGPRTKDGKAVSRLNAVRHGILSRETLVLGEKERDLVAFGRRLRADLAPEGELELLLVDRIISNAWRLRRCLKVETAMLNWRRVQEIRHGSELEVQTWAGTAEGELDDRTTWEKLTRYEVALERSMYRSLHELERRQAIRRGARVIPPAVLDVTVSGIETPG